LNFEEFEMGGNIFKDETRRYSREEYLVAERTVLAKIRWLFGVTPYTIPYYHVKESFGDMDLILPVDKITSDWKNQLIELFDLSKNQYSSNGNVFSFVYNQFQIDIITAKDDNAAKMAVAYFSYNDLGNLIGRIFHKLGLKYGHKGLSLVVRPDDNQHVLQEILLTRDMKAIFPIIGLSYDEFQNGFENLEDVFKFVAKSTFFDPEIFLFHNRNHKAVIRDRKRATYNSFLNWIKETNPSANYSFENKDERGGYNIREPFYSEIVVPVFPWVKDIVNDLITRYELVKKAKERIDGLIIREITGLEGKDLGEFIQKFDLSPSQWSNVELQKFLKISAKYPELVRVTVELCFSEWMKSDVDERSNPS
jgi:hypothetical protein